MKSQRSYVNFGALALFCLGVAGCEQTPKEDPVSVTAEFELPEPIANNAVAVADGPDGPTLYSFNGLKSGKQWSDASKSAFACVIASESCSALPDVPIPEGRLASAAVTVAGKIYIFGGYSVAEDGEEASTPEVIVFDPQDNSYTRVSDMPLPVDDMVALPYRNRYIYLISGWHDEGNVNTVQLYDTQFDTWSEASEFPGTAVFGHAGGLSNNSIIIADGVAVAPDLVNGKRKFVEAPFVWRGDINPGNPELIDWKPVEAHPGTPRYRMAAMGDNSRGQVIFAGGGDNPYNYDGIGYDGVPAKPAGRIFAYDLKSDGWQELGRLAEPSMDHRSLVKSGSDYYILGGMDSEQNVLSRIMKFRIAE